MDDPDEGLDALMADHTNTSVGGPHGHASPEVLRNLIISFFKSTAWIYDAILRYHPLEFELIYATLQDADIKCSTAELVETLDTESISYKTAAGSARTKKQKRGGSTKMPRKT